MKIVYIINLKMPTEKAYGYQVAKMCEQFALLGADVELWFAERGCKERASVHEFYGIENSFQIKRVRVPDIVRFSTLIGPFAFYIQGLIFVLRLLFAEISNNAVIYSRNPEVVWLFSLKGFKVVFDAHNWPTGKNRIFKFLTRRAGLIVCNSSGTAEKFKKNGFQNVIAVPNGVDLKDFENLEKKEKLREKLFLPLDKKIVMYAGHLYKWKGPETLIGAAEKLRERKDILFVLVGGLEKDIKRCRNIAMAKDLDNIVFTGYKEKKLIPSYLKSADILVLPNEGDEERSAKYTSPIKLFEYMASRRPIIASDLPSIKEILDEEKAYFFEAGNSRQLADKILECLNSESVSKGKAEDAFQEVQKYTWRRRGEKIMREIEKLG